MQSCVLPQRAASIRGLTSRSTACKRGSPAPIVKSRLDSGQLQLCALSATSASASASGDASASAVQLIGALRRVLTLEALKATRAFRNSVYK